MGHVQKPPAISALPTLRSSGSSQPSQPPPACSWGTSALSRSQKCHCVLGKVSERWSALQRQLWHGSEVKEELVHCPALGIQIPGRFPDIQVVRMAMPAPAPTCLQPLSTGTCVPLGLHLRFLFVWLLLGFFCGCCFFTRTCGNTWPNLTAGCCTLCSQNPQDLNVALCIPCDSSCGPQVRGTGGGGICPQLRCSG